MIIIIFSYLLLITQQIIEKITLKIFFIKKLSSGFTTKIIIVDPNIFVKKINFLVRVIHRINDFIYTL